MAPFWEAASRRRLVGELTGKKRRERKGRKSRELNDLDLRILIFPCEFPVSMKIPTRVVAHFGEAASRRKLAGVLLKKERNKREYNEMHASFVFYVCSY